MPREGVACGRLLVFRESGRFVLMTIFVALSVMTPSCALLSRLGPPPKPGAALQPSAAPAWYAQNGPIIKAYLESLPPSSVGSKLPGIRLSDGKLWLEGLTYLGPGQNLPPGLRVRLVEDESALYAYLWLEEGAEPLLLTACRDGSQKGIRARQAGGGVFAWKQLSAKAGVVYTECPPAEWLPEGATLTHPSKAS
ncbi:MAG: hypothetical protein CMN75_14845 [Spirochaeta sp.]|nr:hypothetical protein [Spirochaeta sp.]RPG12458.1 MAG: hypothetical protein CBC32_003325 [Proteobacteria bacterium TMED72]